MPETAASRARAVRPPRGADHGANNARNPSEQQRSARRPERRPRQSPHRDARAELDGHRAAGRRRQLIRDEFAGCQERQDPRCPGVTQEGEPRVVEAKPPEMRSPADRRGRRHGAQPGEDSNQQREQISDHKSLYRSGDTLRHRNLSCSVRGSAFLVRVSRQPSLIGDIAFRVRQGQYRPLIQFS